MWTSTTYLDRSPWMRRTIASTSFSTPPETRKTRREARSAASFCLFFDRTRASYRDGEGALSWMEGGVRWMMYSWRSLYSLALRVMRRALRTTGCASGSAGVMVCRFRVVSKILRRRIGSRTSRVDERGKYEDAERERNELARISPLLGCKLKSRTAGDLGL
jgi:hypothetical protein